MFYENQSLSVRFSLITSSLLVQITNIRHHWNRLDESNLMAKEFFKNLTLGFRDFSKTSLSVRFSLITSLLFVQITNIRHHWNRLDESNLMTK